MTTRESSRPPLPQMTLGIALLLGAWSAPLLGVLALIVRAVRDGRRERAWDEERREAQLLMSAWLREQLRDLEDAQWAGLEAHWHEFLDEFGVTQ